MPTYLELCICWPILMWGAEHNAHTKQPPFAPSTAAGMLIDSPISARCFWAHLKVTHCKMHIAYTPINALIPSHRSVNVMRSSHSCVSKLNHETAIFKMTPNWTSMAVCSYTSRQARDMVIVCFMFNAADRMSFTWWMTSETCAVVAPIPWPETAVQGRKWTDLQCRSVGIMRAQVNV